MKISEMITDRYKLRIPPTVYYDLLADVVEIEEQEPTTKNDLGVDLISRADAIKAMQNKAKELKNEDTINGLCGAVAILFELPSVTLQPCEDAISRQALLNATVNKNSIWNKITDSKGENLEAIVSKLPSVTPQPKTGHWIDCSNGWMCSVCKRDNRKETNFCPNCGADMREVEE